ncbi:hypothetical protein IFM89_034482 [Coptis chinensis]|uniref:protein-serine/threonine phosphatase n=1 Tax=Coptis chinensis TaxID=261450 RepID=A0A835LJF5_9MAGN|nr:hypothetical protein IFM89_034482 [Coptis chinensis]
MDLAEPGQIDNVNRPLPVPKNGFMRDILWADPHRGIGWIFDKDRKANSYGHDVAENFLKANGLIHMFRGHEVADNGVDKIQAKVWTIFSAPGYQRRSNRGAVVEVTDKLAFNVTTLEREHKEYSPSGRSQIPYRYRPSSPRWKPPSPRHRYRSPKQKRLQSLGQRYRSSWRDQQVPVQRRAYGYRIPSARWRFPPPRHRSTSPEQRRLHSLRQRYQSPWRVRRVPVQRRAYGYRIPSPRWRFPSPRRRSRSPEKEEAQQIGEGSKGTRGKEQ